MSLSHAGDSAAGDSAAGDSAIYEFDTTGKSGSTAATMGWTETSFSFTATGSISTLAFTSLHAPAFHPDRAQGAALDNIRVSEAVADTDGDGVSDDEDPFPNSNLDATVSSGSCDSGVGNQALGDGSTFNDHVGAAADGAQNHGAYVSAVSKLADQWKKAGLISGRDKGKITSCAARSDIP